MGDLNTKLVQYSNGQKEVGCLIVQYFNAIWIPDSQTILIPDKSMLSCFLMYWSSIWMVGLDKSHSTTIWILNHQKIWFSNSLSLDCFKLKKCIGEYYKVFKWSELKPDHLNAEPFKNWTSKCLNFEGLELRLCQYSGQ